MGKCVFQCIKVIAVLHCIKYYVPRDERELTVELKTWLWNLTLLFSLFLISKVR